MVCSESVSDHVSLKTYTQTMLFLKTSINSGDHQKNVEASLTKSRRVI